MAELLGFVLGDFRKGLVLLKSDALFLLFRIKLFVILFDCEEFCLDLDHLFLVQLQELHVSHLLLVGDGLLSLVQVR